MKVKEEVIKVSKEVVKVREVVVVEIERLK